MCGTPDDAAGRLVLDLAQAADGTSRGHGWVGSSQVGALEFQCRDGALVVTVLYVRPAWRRRGLARRMLALLQERTGCRTLCLPGRP